MSTKIVVCCDYQDGNCCNEFDALNATSVDDFGRPRIDREAINKNAESILIEHGWSIRDDKHFCPEHTIKD